MAGIHAEAVIAQVKALDCSTEQKLELVEAVIQTAKRIEREQTS